MQSHELLIVGDVHEMWDDVDRAFVEAGSQDVVVFVGDFGEEDVALVAAVDAISCPHVVMLGNHDAWYASRKNGDDARVRAQLDGLGERHIAYRSWLAPDGDYALVGGRPFSWGGGWSRQRDLYQRLYDVSDTEQSVERIVAAAATVPAVPLVVIGHNGPRGLGEGPDGIFGCDFRQPFVDFGDRDLALAIARLKEHGRAVALTVAGHMHHRLVGGGLRTRRVDRDGTVYLNAARVPRHEWSDGGRRRHFVRVQLAVDQGQASVTSAEDIWVDDDVRVCSSESLDAKEGNDVGEPAGSLRAQ